MKLKIIVGLWKIEKSDDEILAETNFPSRVIRYNPSNMDDYQMFKHCMIHELTHAYQAELGQWQNVSSNGKRNDDFDSEWIAEFVAIYSEQILNDFETIKELYKQKLD